MLLKSFPERDNLKSTSIKHSYPWKVPRNTVIDLFCLFYGTFEPAVGEGVFVVELQTSFIRKVAITSFREDVLDAIVGHDSGREVNEVFTPRL